ncbi:MAG: hypothetical protein JSR69_19375 [Proteobacteria bacterium]|nr:hypothetical protein [Pseudomonadota bacterium]
MLRILVWLSGSIVLLAAAAVVLAFQAVESSPLVTSGAAPAPAALMRAKAILRKNDPRKLARDERREITISGPDLDALVALAARRGLQADTRVDLRQGGAELRYSAQLPRNPLGRYLNVNAQLGAGTDGLRFEQVRIGRVPVPPALFQAAVTHYLQHTQFAPDLALLARSIDRIAITPTGVRMAYTWQPELLDSARALAIDPTRRDGLADAQRRLVARIDSLGSRSSAPLATVLGPLLQEAGERTNASERSNAYRNLLLVTAAQLSGHDIALLIPEARQWPRPHPITLTLRGREDLAQHFTVSAALAAWAGEPLANAIGLDKEVSDSRGGSGFSFVDLAADRAGTRLGQLAVRDPERLAAGVSAGLRDTSLLPPIDGLPESMMADEFQRRFGGVDAPAYKRMADEVERRVAALALFR